MLMVVPNGTTVIVLDGQKTADGFMWQQAEVAVG